MKMKVKANGTHDGAPLTIEIEAEYTLTEMLGLLKVYPKTIEKVMKVFRQNQQENNQPQEA